MIDGLVYNLNLKDAFEKVFYHHKTKPTTVLFETFDDEDNLKKWQNFNGSIMSALQWSLVLSGSYDVEFDEHYQDCFKSLPLKELFKAYPLNKGLPMKTLITRVTESKVIIYGLDVNAKDMAFGVIDIENKKINTGTGQNNLTEVLGSYYSTMLFKYLNNPED